MQQFHVNLELPLKPWAVVTLDANGFCMQLFYDMCLYPGQRLPTTLHKIAVLVTPKMSLMMQDIYITYSVPFIFSHLRLQVNVLLSTLYNIIYTVTGFPSLVCPFHVVISLSL